jgi:hypothetical protein
MNSLATLAEMARIAKPRLFAVYGLRHHPDAPPIIGWGMEFEGQDDVLFYLPEDSVTHHTVSAERVAQRYSQLGEMHIDWFDDEPSGRGEPVR